MFPPPIYQSAEALGQRCLELGLRLVFAESCTGGLIAGAVISVPGASRFVDRGFVVYSYESKEDELGVSPALHRQHGGVSEPVAIAMAQGALKHGRGGRVLSIATTGVAGPGFSEAKPAGLVHIAVACQGQEFVLHERYQFDNLGRDYVRMETVLAALRQALRYLEKFQP